MSTVFTKLYDSTAMTRPVAANVIPTQDSTGSQVNTVRHDQVVPFSGKYRIFSQYITGSLTGLGTSTAGVNGTVWYVDIFVPYINTWTGIGVLNGATVGTDNGLVALFDSSGALVANSALAGAVTAGASAFQQRAFTATYTNLRPGRFWIGYSSNGTTDNFQTIKTTTILDALTTSATGTFGTVAALTPPTTFTADKGPIAYLY